MKYEGLDYSDDEDKIKANNSKAHVETDGQYLMFVWMWLQRCVKTMPILAGYV